MRKWFDKHLFVPLLERRNARFWEKQENRDFLESLCVSNHTLDLDKYLQLMKMVKRKYKKKKKSIDF